MVNGGNNMAKGLGNIGAMMKQAQELQKQMAEMQYGATEKPATAEV